MPPLRLEGFSLNDVRPSLSPEPANLTHVKHTHVKPMIVLDEIPDRASAVLNRAPLDWSA